MSLLGEIWEWLKSSPRKDHKKWHPDLNPIDIQKISRELNQKLTGPETAVVFKIEEARTNYLSWSGLPGRRGRVPHVRHALRALDTPHQDSAKALRSGHVRSHRRLHPEHGPGHRPLPRRAGDRCGKGQSYAKSLNGFYIQVTEENGAAFKVLIEEVRKATSRLADSVDAYSSGINGNLESIERKVTEFAGAVTSRLANTTFPDDFFARELKAPLEQLKCEASTLGGNVRAVSSLVQESSRTLAAVLKQITSKTKKTQDAKDALVLLSEQHRTLVNNADLQLNTLVKLAERMEQVDVALKGALDVIGTNSNLSAELLTKVCFLTTEGSTLRLEIKDSMLALTTKLDANATLATGVIQKLESQEGGLRTSASEVIASFEQESNSSEKLAWQLSATEIVFQGVVEQLQVISGRSAAVAATATRAAQYASTAAQSASHTSDSVDNAVAQVAEVLAVCGKSMS